MLRSKALDLNIVAEYHLYRSITKIKPIATSPSLPKDILAKGQGHNPCYGAEDSAAAMNVTARLYNSNPVKAVMSTITERFRSVLGVEIDKKLRKEDGKHKSAKGKGDTGASQYLRGLESSYVVQSVSSKSESPHESRLAGHTSDETDSEKEEVMAEVDLDPSDSEDSDDSRLKRADKQSQKLVSNVKEEKSSQKPPIKANTFLPSLAMGGYWSGSESAPDTSDEEAAKIRPRKNRRGQKARRTLWEKKYGSGANHVKKSTQGRDSGWDPRKGAQAEETGSRSNYRSKGKPRGKEKENGKTQSAQRGNRPNRKERRSGSDTKKIHPSWEAAKRKQEEKKVPEFQGKKIVFD